jgi:hypothetical protein
VISWAIEFASALSALIVWRAWRGGLGGDAHVGDPRRIAPLRAPRLADGGRRSGIRERLSELLPVRAAEREQRVPDPDGRAFAVDVFADGAHLRPRRPVRVDVKHDEAVSVT